MKSQLSPKEFGEATGVSESSVKRWIDAGLIASTRTAGGHRRIAIEEAVRYVRENRLRVLKPQALGLADVTEREIDLNDPRLAHRALSHALQTGLAPQARGIILSLYLGGQSVAAIADGPIAAAMHEIGELWKKSPAGVHVEHRATDICLQAVAQLRTLLPPPADDAPIAVGAAPTGDPYLLPTMLAAATLVDEGWRAVNLGPQTPFDVLSLAIGEYEARLVWLSITARQKPDWITGEVANLARYLGQRRGFLIVGGRETPRPFVASADNLHIGQAMAELAAFARGVRQLHHSLPHPTHHAAAT
jgi:excisionase family DNA binding protein